MPSDVVLQRAALPGRELAAGLPVSVSPQQVARLAADPGGGKSLSTEARARLEPLVGRPLDDVRLHSGPRAGAAARALSARAFTIGRDVFFGEGQPGPSTPEGRALLAHEATHVAQQVPIGLASPGAAEDTLEAAARRTERRMLDARARTGQPLVVGELAFHVANEADPGLQARAPRIFALAEQEARGYVATAVSAEPALRATLSAAEVDEPEVVVPVTLTVDGKPDELLARELGWAVGRRVVEEARLLAARRSTQSGGLGVQRSPVESAAGQAEQVALPAPQRPRIPPDTQAMMRADVERIVTLLRQQWMSDGDERQALSIVEKWAGADDRYNADTGYQGSDYLDRFLFLLKTRTYTRRTARTAWIEQWASAYDDLWHELEDDRLDRFKSLVSRSKRQATTGPETQRMESVWSAVGKQEALGVWGILKAMGLALAGIADTVIWAQWKTTGWPLAKVLQAAGVKVSDQPPSLTPYLSKSYDEVAKLMGQAFGVDPSKDEVAFGMGAYQFGETFGKVPAGLMTAGALAEAGAVGQALGVAQTAQAAEQLYDTVKRLRKGPPPLSWADIARRPDVWAQVVGVVGGAIGSAGGFAQAGSAASKALTNLGIGANATQIALLVAAYRAVDEDPTLRTPEEKQRAKAEFLVQMATTGLLSVDMRYGPRFKAAWERHYQQGTGQKPPGAGAEVAPVPEATGAPGGHEGQPPAVSPPARGTAGPAETGKPVRAAQGAPVSPSAAFEMGMQMGLSAASAGPAAGPSKPATPGAPAATEGGATAHGPETAGPGSQSGPPKPKSFRDIDLTTIPDGAKTRYRAGWEKYKQDPSSPLRSEEDYIRYRWAAENHLIPEGSGKGGPRAFQVEQAAGRVAEDVWSAVSGDAHNTREHSTSSGNVKPDFMPPKAEVRKVVDGKVQPAESAKDALLIADTKVLSKPTATGRAPRSVGLTPQVRGLVELAAQTQSKTLVLIGQEGARISKPLRDHAKQMGVEIVVRPLVAPSGVVIKG